MGNRHWWISAAAICMALSVPLLSAPPPPAPTDEGATSQASRPTKTRIPTRRIDRSRPLASSAGEDRRRDSQVRSAGAESPPASERPINAESARRPIARVTQREVSLPREQGQVWREYDITPFTSRAIAARPEQAIVDWILRETGYEAWHSEPLAVLSATSTTLRVYHTVKMQDVVAEIVDRFVNPAEERHGFGMRIVSLDNPNWRARAPVVMRPVEVASQGVSAWLLAKEDAALLFSELRKRGDFREHGSPTLLVSNGLPTVVSEQRTRSFVQYLLGPTDQMPVYQMRSAVIEEGIAVELAALASLDGAMADAAVKCHIDQLEKLHPIVLESGGPLTPRDRPKVDVPQWSSIRVKETFRWSTNDVLLVSLGMVPAPTATDDNLLSKALTLNMAPRRKEVLLFIDSRGRTVVLPGDDGNAEFRMQKPE